MTVPGHGHQPNEPFAAPARPAAELWRTLLGAILAIAVYVGLLVGLGLLLRVFYGRFLSAVVYIAMVRGATPGAMLMLLFSFLALAIGFAGVTRLVHRRRAGTLFGDRTRLLADFTRVALALGALDLALLPLALTDGAVTRHLDIPTFLTFLPFGLVALLVQTGAEELAFRGYLQQQLAVRFKSRWVWMLIPALLFASAHYSRSLGPSAGLIVIWATFFALSAADLTARTGSLGAAIGLHFANNFGVFFLIGVNGDMNGLALWSQTVDYSRLASIWPLIAVDFLRIAVGWLLARLVLRV